MIKIPLNTNTPFNTTNNSISNSLENESILKNNILNNKSQKYLFNKLENLIDERNIDIKNKNPIKRIKSEELISNLEIFNSKETISFSIKY
jgi:hypothetical protein